VYDVTGPLNTCQLNCIAKRNDATTLQSSGSTCNADTSLDELVEERGDHDLLVHAVDTSCTSVDVFHAYCALAVVKHRLSDCQCTLNCCRDELTARELAGLCRLLLWDVDMYQRRSEEELLYIEQLQTSLSINTNQPAGQQSSRPSQESDSSVTSDRSRDTAVSDKLSSHASSCDESTVMRTCIKQDLVDECGTTAADTAEMNIVSDVDGASPAVQLDSDWQNLPVDVKYSTCQLSVELLQQEADRLRHLSDGITHCTVITSH